MRHAEEDDEQADDVEEMPQDEDGDTDIEASQGVDMDSLGSDEDMDVDL